MNNTMLEKDLKTKIEDNIIKNLFRLKKEIDDETIKNFMGQVKYINFQSPMLMTWHSVL